MQNHFLMTSCQNVQYRKPQLWSQNCQAGRKVLNKYPKSLLSTFHRSGKSLLNQSLDTQDFLRLFLDFLWRDRERPVRIWSNRSFQMTPRLWKSDSKLWISLWSKNVLHETSELSHKEKIFVFPEILNFFKLFISLSRWKFTSHFPEKLSFECPYAVLYIDPSAMNYS